MKQTLFLAASIICALVWVVPVHAGSSGAPAAQEQGTQVQQSDQGGKPVDSRVVPPYMSARQKVMIQREIQKRAAASRNAIMREALMEREAQQGSAGRAPQQGVK
jgi:hypothetical protein